MVTNKLVKAMLSTPELRDSLRKIMQVQSVVRKQLREHLVIYSLMIDQDGNSVEDVLIDLFENDELDKSEKSVVIELLGGRSPLLDTTLRIQ